MSKAILAIFTAFILSTAVSAQSTYEFLRLDASPRAAAMGGSMSAATDDPDVIFYNPAGLAYLTATPVSFTFVKHLLDVNMAGLSASRKFEDWGRFAVGVKYINYGTFTETNEYGEKMGDFGAGEIALQIAYADFLGENFSYGVSAKYLHSTIASYSSSAAAVDFGLNYAVPEQRLNIGISLLNAGSQISSYGTVNEDLPIDLRLGASKKLQYLPLRIFLDVPRLNEKGKSFSEKLKAFTIGGEFTLSKTLRLRVGLDNQKRSDLKIANFAGLAGFSFGAAVNVQSYTFHYAFTSLGQVGSMQRIGISSNFDF